MTGPGSSGPPRGRPLLALVAALVASAVAALAFIAKMGERTGGRLSLPLDDAYIYLQYARRLAAGHLLSYTEGAAPSTGASSWMHMILLSGAFRLGVEGENAIWVSIALGTAYLALSLWLVHRVTRALVSGPATAVWAFAATAAVALDWTVLLAAFSGMETTLYTAALLGVVLGLCRDGRPPWWSWATAAFLSWVRPEGLVMGGFALLALTWAARSRARAAVPGRRPPWAGTLVPAVLAFAVAFVPVGVGWALTGTPQTDTFAVKGVAAVPTWAGRSEMIAAIPRSWGRQLYWLLTNFRVPGEQPLPKVVLRSPEVVGISLIAFVGGGLLAALLSAVWRRRAAVLVLGGFIVLGVFLTSLSWWSLARYAAPYAPLVIVTAVSGLSAISRLIRPRPLKAVFAGIAILAAAVYAGSPVTPHVLDGYSWNCENSHNQQRKVGEWLRDNTPPGTIVAVNDAGAIAYFSGRPIIDLVGLTTHGWAECVHERPGSVFEKLEALPPAARPGVLAIYDEAYPNLLRCGLVDRLLFAAVLEHNTINASAAKYVVATKWDRPVDRHAPLIASVAPRTIVDAINVAHLADERAHSYGILGRAASVVSQHPSGAPDGPPVIEGARLVSGAETFTVSVTPGRDLAIVVRGTVDGDWDVPVFVEGVEAARFRSAARPGFWSECVATVPGATIRSSRVGLTIGNEPVRGAPPPAPRQVAYYWFAQ